MISCQGIKIVHPPTEEDLQVMAREAIMVFVAAGGPDDPACSIGEKLHDDCRIVSEIVAVTPDLAYDVSMQVLASGFDNVFSLSELKRPDFRKIINNKICKGRVRLRGRMQDEEYQRFRAALDVSPDAFIVFDENNRLFFVSEHYRRAYPHHAGRLARGLPVAEAYEMLCGEHGVHAGHPDYAPLKTFWHSLEGQIEFTDSTGRTVRVSAGKMPDGRGTIVSTTDITEYRRQQTLLESRSLELADALKKEQEAGAIQKQFIDMVSHEFRTPLTIIDGNAQHLQRRAEKTAPEEIVRRSKTIRSAVGRVIQLMDGLLSSSMVHTGRMEIIKEDLDLGGLVRQLVGEYQDLDKGHEFVITQENLPEAVRLDRKVTTLILSNLLANAVKYTKDQPRIGVYAGRRNGHIVLRVEDNGVGIPPDEQQAVFKRFYRATTSAGTPGTGIGLNLARELVELQGGRITLESDLGKGSRFTVELPASES